MPDTNVVLPPQDLSNLAATTLEDKNVASNESATESVSSPEQVTSSEPAPVSSEQEVVLSNAPSNSTTLSSDSATPSQTSENKPDIDKEFIENLLSSLQVEAKTAKERKQLVYDFATIMMDPSFKQLYNSLSKSLPPQYFDDHGMLPVVKKEFISRIQEEIIKGSFVEPDHDMSIEGLRDKKREITKDNAIIKSAEDESETLKYPIPTWIMEDLDEKLKRRVEQQEVKETEKNDEEMKESVHSKREYYDANKNNQVEEQLDTTGMWPLKAVKDTEPEVKKRGNHSSGSFITKNIQITKDGTRVAYGGGKRKNATARVFIRKGTGKIDINGRSLIDYFPMGNNRDQVLAPLAITMTFQKYDIHATVTGGGTTGQSEAIRIALAKALEHYQNTYGPILSKAGLLTADPRIVERKKPGRRKARRPQQWVKR